MDLSKYDKMYDNANAPVGGFDPVPDGTYQVRVEKAQLLRSKAGNPMLKWEMVILAPSSVGRRLWHHNMLHTEQSLGFTKRDLAYCGIVLDRLSSLHNRLNELLDIVIEIQAVTTLDKKNGEDRQNIYIVRKLEMAPPVSDAPPIDDDGIPPF